MAETTEVKQTPLTPEQETARLKKLHEKLRARMSISKLQVTGPPGWTPYWARKEDASEMARLDFKGFRVVKETDPSKPRYRAQGKREDGTYQLGDVILMEMPTEEYEFFLQENRDRSSGMVAAARDAFIENAAKNGAPTFQLTKKAS